MTKLNLNKDFIFWTLAFMFSSLGAYFVFLTTTWGAGLTSDSIAYVTGARDILKNNNLASLGSHWPPLYFILIAFSGSIAGDVLDATRWLQIITVFLSTMLFGYIVYTETRRTLYLPISG